MGLLKRLLGMFSRTTRHTHRDATHSSIHGTRTTSLIGFVRRIFA